MDRFIIINNGKPVMAPKHKCDLPGWNRRRKLGLIVGSQIRCSICDKRWQFYQGYEKKFWKEI